MIPNTEHPSHVELVRDDSPAGPPLRDFPGPRRDQLFAFVAGAVATGRPFPKYAEIDEHMGWSNRCNRATPMLKALRARGLLARYYPTAGRRQAVWMLTELGLERFRSQQAETLLDTKQRQPRRTGAPKRVPHKPTSAHQKPSRQERREIERRRKHQDRVTL